MVLQAYNPRTWKVEAEGIQGQNKLDYTESLGIDWAA